MSYEQVPVGYMIDLRDGEPSLGRGCEYTGMEHRSGIFENPMTKNPKGLGDLESLIPAKTIMNGAICRQLCAGLIFDIMIISLHQCTDS